MRWVKRLFRRLQPKKITQLPELEPEEEIKKILDKEERTRAYLSAQNQAHRARLEYLNDIAKALGGEITP